MALSVLSNLGSAYGKDKVQGSIIYYSYSYQGSMCRSGEYCKVEAKEDGSIIALYSDQGQWGVIKAYRAPDDALELIEKKVSEGRLRSLKSDYCCEPVYSYGFNPERHRPSYIEAAGPGTCI